MLEVVRVESGYGRVPIVRGVSLSVGPGEVVGIAGRNGVGKTTLARTIIGLIRHRGGAIRLNGVSMDDKGPAARARAGIGYVPQGRQLFADMSVADNLKVGTEIGVVGRSEHAGLTYDLVMDLFPGLRKMLRRRAGSMSGGEQQMLAIARVLIGRPLVLVLDEPSEGIQPSIVAEIGLAIRRLGEEVCLGALLIEQNVGALVATADRVHVMEKGAIVAELSGKELDNGERLSSLLTL